MRTEALALPLPSSPPPAPAPRRGVSRLPISEHTRFIQDVRAAFPGARVVDHTWNTSDERR